MQGKLEGGLYQLDVLVFSTSSFNFPLVSLAHVKSTESWPKVMDAWNSRLGHPYDQVLNDVLTILHLSLIAKNLQFCEASQSEKQARWFQS